MGITVIRWFVIIAGMVVGAVMQVAETHRLEPRHRQLRDARRYVKPALVGGAFGAAGGFLMGMLVGL